MQWVTQVLKLTVVIKVSGPSSVELQRLEEGEFLCRGVSAQACVGKELLKARLHGRKRIWSDFRKFEPLSTTRNQFAVWNHINAKRLEVNVPGLNQQPEKRGANLVRDLERLALDKPPALFADLVESLPRQLGHELKSLFIWQAGLW